MNESQIPSSEAHIAAGAAFQEAGQFEAALAHYEKAAELAPPGFESPLSNKAQLLMEMGQIAESLKTVDQALSINPRSAHAWFLRGQMKNFTAGDADLPKMESALIEATGMARILLHFTLGKAWMDVGDGDRAFAHLQAGNRLRRSSFRYNPEATRRWMASIGESFAADLPGKFAGAGDPSDRPIFVIGMPRSGTTLVEQILASHPEVFGAGESPLLDRIARTYPGDGRPPFGYPKLLSELSAATLDRMGRSYVAAIGAGISEARIVDKMPTNFLYAGLIHLMLPNARIIHCRRNPLDTCVSCYSKHFIAGVEFSYDLAELGAFYQDYERLMERWRALLPSDRFLEIDYEELVEDLPAQAARLVDFCGLEWDDACLSFHQTKRAVRTASAMEVRRPIHRDSVQRWKAYEKHLGPLLAALAG